MTDQISYYRPDGLNKLLWLAAKNKGHFDSEMDTLEKVRLAMSEYSGCSSENIRLADMFDVVVLALGDYYQHKGINANELLNLLSPLFCHYAGPVEEKFNQADANCEYKTRIIENCMSHLTIARVLSEEKDILVMLD